MRKRQTAADHLARQASLPVDGLQELSLMGSHSTWIYCLNKLGVLVNEPGLSQHVGSRVFQLETPEQVVQLS